MDTNPTEMKTLVGLLILQGIVKKPENGMHLSSLTTAETWRESTGMMANCKAKSWLENV